MRVKMEKYIFNDKFIGLIKDDRFIQIALSSENSDDLLKKMLFQNPGNREDIRYAFEFILVIKNEHKSLSDIDSDLILKRIEKKMEFDKTRHFSWYMVWKVAAVFFIVLFVSSVFFYSKYYRDPFKQYSEVNQKQISHSLIVLSDGSKHIISDNESKIDYTVYNDSVVINKKGKKIKKINNKKTNKKNVMNQVLVPFGQQQNIVLNDGTTVTLNSGSRLIFPSSFTGNIRKVALSGEGYFHVHKDSLHPFIVKTKHINVKVLGTIFDLSAYEDDNVISAVLVKGSINVLQKDNEKSSVVSPGEGCFYSVHNRKSEIKSVNVCLYTSWKDGVYLFENESLIEVIKRIEKYYNVNIKTNGENISEIKISGKLIISGKAEEALKYISKTIGCEFEKKNDGDYVIK